MGAHPKVLASIAEGLRYVRGNRALVGSFAIDLVAMTFGMPRALFAVLAVSVFHAGAAGTGVLYAAVPAGATVAALLTGWINHARRLGIVVIWAVAVWGAAVALAGLMRSLWPAAALLAVAGAADSVWAVCRSTINQTVTPDHMRGRMSSVFSLVVTGGPRLGDIESGSSGGRDRGAVLGRLRGPAVHAGRGGHRAGLPSAAPLRHRGLDGGAGRRHGGPYRRDAGGGRANVSRGHGHDLGYFDDDSVIRRVLRERALALSGPRALLMQAAHPLAVAGLLAHSDALEDPYVRLARTAKIMNLITFGSRAEADRVTRRVRAMHRAVAGRLPESVGRYPAGTPYRADDPELLMWILYSLVDSAVVVYRTYVGRLGEADRAALWEDYKVIGRLFGLRVGQMPHTWRTWATMAGRC